MDASSRPPVHLRAWVLLGAMLGGCSHAESEALAKNRRLPSNTVTAAQIALHPTSASVEDLLVRLVPGVQLRRRTDGTVGLRLMGLASRQSDGGPLFVVDGIPIEHTGPVGINPRDIATMRVLKEGGSIAQYGVRGGNGVVVITTKNSGIEN
jgi:TonB-dependent starch-binding outer membrane protein SusC